jgi:hypothetical protein
MKPGSLVIVKPLGLELGPSSLNGVLVIIKWLPIQDENTIYMVREIVEGAYGDQPCAALEEGIIGHSMTGMELYININMLREVQPPMEISVSDIIKDLQPCETVETNWRGNLQQLVDTIERKRKEAGLAYANVVI